MIRVLIDENISEHFAEGLNQLQYPLKNDIELTSIHKEFHKGILDEDWIPKWALQSGVFITQDLGIINSDQAFLLKNNIVGAFFLKPPKGCDYWDRVELVINNWTKIVRIIEEEKVPYKYFITPRKIGRC
ncbi:hypothetical protein [Pedobacter gandavensis]|uniref:PIN-like domain-containing protein n=1 Tax=Pedobacter gandavensis TaxID=2679963 RepID=UPI002930CA11|nr:hypothetical protein [Pedobacter gandavensis]